MRSLMSRSLFAIIILVFAIASTSCGRTTSRMLGADYAQILEIDGSATEILSVSFDKRNNATVKDVTFRADDGYYYTKEFKDISPFEGIIRWVPNDESESVLQSRTLSRWFGTPVNLRLPQDCARILNVDIGYSSSNERVKNLVYLSTDGRIRAKEYREGFISRNFEGWLEIKISGKTATAR